MSKLEKSKEEMSYVAAIQKLHDVLLGEDYYVSLPVSSEQVNAELVYVMERWYKNEKHGKKIFQKAEKDEKIRDRLLKLCKEGDYGICPPPMASDVALKELSEFFLGNDMTATLDNYTVVRLIERRCRPIMFLISND